MDRPLAGHKGTMIRFQWLVGIERTGLWIVLWMR